jgi:hypothetical protein
MAKWKDKKKQADVKNDFMAFVKHVWPEFIEGKHHKQVAKKFNDIANGKTKRVIINIDQWEVIQFPAIMPTGKPLWPEYWNLKDLESVRASIPLSKWNAQYMQNPTGEEGALIKREWWQNWEKDLPPLEHVIQSYDTAFMKKETADLYCYYHLGCIYSNRR